MLLKIVLAGLCLVSTASIALAAGHTSPHQDDPPFKLSDANPVLTIGAAGDWDSGEVGLGAITESDDMLYLFYTGRSGNLREPFSVGLATSTDGLTWQKSPQNPILTSATLDPTRTGDIAYSIEPGDVWVENDTWIMLLTIYNAYANFSGASIWRATAPAAKGPWTADPAPVLTAGSSRRWDSNAVFGPSVVKTDEGYVMYFGGANGFEIGLATSTDGLTWAKFDDPTTEQRLYSESDPIFTKQTSGLSTDGIGWPEVITTPDGFGMFYLAFGFLPSVGYATSPDGRTWTPDSNGAVWTAETQNVFGHTAVIQKGGQFWIYGRFSNNAINLGIWIPAQ